jgi:hypothetical protein
MPLWQLRAAPPHGESRPVAQIGRETDRIERHRLDDQLSKREFAM